MNHVGFENTPNRLQTSLALQNLLWARKIGLLSDCELTFYLEQLETESRLENFTPDLAASDPTQQHPCR